MKVLDCTLRDGGYYNSWDFSPELVSDYLFAMEAAKVDIIEIGLRSIKNNTYAGPYAYTQEQHLKDLNISKNIKVSVMINASEFNLLADESEDGILSTLNKLFPLLKSESEISVIRIACRYNELEVGFCIGDLLAKKGFIVGINLMQAADINNEQLRDFATRSRNSLVEVIYLADSTGSMCPDDVTSKLSVLKKFSDKELGIHTHDNIGLALANTVAAFNVGASWLDATVTGMGRGPGNAKTEELLVELNLDRRDNVDIIPLLGSMEKYFLPLQKRFKWGKNIYYFISGKKGIHPSFVQSMIADGRFDESDIVNALNKLSGEESKIFSDDKLIDINTFYNKPAKGSWVPETVFFNRSVLILGSGPSVKQHAKQIEHYIHNFRPIVVALNMHELIDDKLINYRTACHPIRFLTDAGNYSNQQMPIITPLSSHISPQSLDNLDSMLLDFGMQVRANEFSFDNTSCITPSPLVLSYTLGVVMSGKVSNIILVGIDGYERGDRRNEEVENILNAFHGCKGSTEIFSLTPTVHRNIKTKSIYGMFS